MPCHEGVLGEFEFILIIFFVKLILSIIVLVIDC
jgi:hypothetical protein